ncbi:MAG TPA: alpha-ketoglutarate-dependent dioxygenase AlkB [Rhizomicrobium sp.]|nr:alpha-ketoglutarate-dependent dioxygenase AlkB [Rhizomicrobium sp.]
MLAHFTKLDFAPFQFQGWLGKRHVVSFGWRYDYNQARFSMAAPIPDFLLPIRIEAARFAGLQPEALEQALVTRYDSGAGIGWHRDRPVFETVVGISLLALCVLRFRRREEKGFQRASLQIEPRSIYKLSGTVRDQWEHSIAEMDKTRYSVTFRSLRG